MTRLKFAFVVILTLLLMGVLGCQAPASLRDAQTWEVQAWQNLLANDTKIDATWATVYRMARQADIEATTKISIDLIKAKAGTPAEVESGIKVLLERRDKALADTEAVCAKMAAMRDVNTREAMSALQLHGKVTEWMEAGLDTSAVPEMAQEVIDLISAFKKPAATP